MLFGRHSNLPMMLIYVLYGLFVCLLDSSLSAFHDKSRNQVINVLSSAPFNKSLKKVECYDAVKTIADKINSRDADMMSHVIMSVFKVASAEANVPVPHNILDSSAAKKFCDYFLLRLITLTTLLLI